MLEKNNITFHLDTLRLLHDANEGDDNMQAQILKICNTIAHAAPEILDKKAWNGIYDLCRTHFTDMTNPVHTKCFDVYNERMKLFKT